MSTKLFTCKDCGSPVALNPPLSQRKGYDGGPMTKREAMSIFAGRTGHRCTDCFIKWRNEDAKELMRRINAATK